MMLQVSSYTFTLFFLFAVFGVVIIGLLCRMVMSSLSEESSPSIETIERSGIKIPLESPLVLDATPQIRPIPGVSYAIKERKRKETELEPIGIIKRREEVRVLRGGEFVGNRMRYKVKVLNDTPYMITDVTVYLIAYPKVALKLSGQHDHQFAKIEPHGFRSPTFEFLPTQDCVRGDILAGVSYIDMTGKAHTLTTEPFVIRSVCDLLIPEVISPAEFALKLKSLEHGELVIKVEEWTPEQMYEKALQITADSNFYEVSSELDLKEGVVFGKISGLAKGKYTGKSVGVQISITGPANGKGASCAVRVSGEDQAMILPAIDDLRERLSAWLCPLCSSPLPLELVEKLRDGEIVECPCCNVTIGR